MRFLSPPLHRNGEGVGGWGFPLLEQLIRGPPEQAERQRRQQHGRHQRVDRTMTLRRIPDRREDAAGQSDRYPVRGRASCSNRQARDSASPSPRIVSPPVTGSSIGRPVQL